MSYEIDDKVLRDLEEDRFDLQWDAKRAKRMIRKTRVRMILLIVSTILGVTFLYFIYSMLVSIVYHETGNNNQYDRFVTTLVETHYPSIRVEKSGGTHASISPLLTQETKLNLYQNVGNWQVNAGTVTATKTLFGATNIQMNFQKQYLNQQDGFTFALPPELLNQAPVTEDGKTEALWSSLPSLPKGSVATVGFSTTKAMSPEEIWKELQVYNLHVIAMPVYSGELKAFKGNSSMSDGRHTYISPLVLRPAMEYGSQSNSMSSAEWLTSPADITRAKTNLLQSVDWLTEQADYPDRTVDQQRLAYLHQNGVQVYGAVVTGSVQEIEKLKNKNNFYHFELDKVESLDNISYKR